MSNVLTRAPHVRHHDRVPVLPSIEPARTPGSYVDADGVRRTPGRVGSYVGRPVAAVGTYTDRDGARRVTLPGSYTRVDG